VYERGAARGAGGVDGGIHAVELGGGIARAVRGGKRWQRRPGSVLLGTIGHAVNLNRNGTDTPTEVITRS
jgi:hypothetical protein